MEEEGLVTREEGEVPGRIRLGCIAQVSLDSSQGRFALSSYKDLRHALFKTRRWFWGELSCAISLDFAGSSDVAKPVA